MTANAMDSDREQCLAAGMVDFVSKPIEPDELWRALLRWIPPRHAASAGTAAAGGHGALQGADQGNGAQAGDDCGLPATISGLDMQAGLRRVLGKRPRYLAMLRGFVANQSGAAAQIAIAADAGDHGTAERLAHTLKGLAGNIGADGLQDAAAELERACGAAAFGGGDAASRHALNAALDAAALALDQQVAAINAALPAEACGAAAAVTVDTALRDDVRAQLVRLLSDDDAQAEKVLMEHQALLASAYPDHIRRLQQAIGQFDFETALAVLEEVQT
jgi:two-component system sensor histidine kinase/response regulator